MGLPATAGRSSPPPGWWWCGSAAIVVADTTPAWRVLETSHPPTWYLPRADVSTSGSAPVRGPRHGVRVEGRRDLLGRLDDAGVIERSAGATRRRRRGSCRSPATSRSCPARSSACRRRAGAAAGGRLLRRLDHRGRGRAVQGRRRHLGLVSPRAVPDRMPRWPPWTTTKILAIIQAGGAGGRMDVLTLERAKPALPFAGQLPAARLPAVQPGQLRDRRRVALGGLPGLGARGAGPQRPALGPRPHPRRSSAAGAAAGDRARWTRRGSPRATPTSCTGCATRSGADPDLVLVMSADHVYRLDYRDVVATHRERMRRSRWSPPTSRGLRRGPGDHAVVEVNRLGRVTVLRLQARRAGDHDGRDRGVPLRAGRAHRDAGGAAPRAVRRAATRATTTRATPGSATSVTCCSRAWSTAARPTPTRSTATGATSASRTTT